MEAALNRKLAAAAILICLAASALAAPQAVPSTGMVALPDGVRVLLRPDVTAPGVGIALVVHTGAPRTPAQVAAAAVAALGLLYGSVNASYNEFARGIQETGGSVRTVIGYDFAGVQMLTGRSQLPDAIYLLCEALKNARYSDRTVSRIFAARNRRRVSPDPVGDLFGATADVPIDRTALAAVTPDAAQQWFERRYSARRTVICVCGDFDEKVVEGLLADRLYDFARPAADIPTLAVPAQPLPDGRIAERSDAAGAAATVSSAITPNCSFADLLALAALLGEGHTSRVYTDLRTNSGLAYAVGASADIQLGRPLTVWAVSGGADSKTLGARLRSDVTAAAAGSFTDSEVRRACAIAATQWYTDHERTADHAWWLAWMEACAGGYTMDAEIPQQLQAITRKELETAAQSCLSACRIVELAPEAADEATPNPAH